MESLRLVPAQSRLVRIAGVGLKGKGVCLVPAASVADARGSVGQGDSWPPAVPVCGPIPTEVQKQIPLGRACERVVVATQEWTSRPAVKGIGSRGRCRLCSPHYLASSLQSSPEEPVTGAATTCGGGPF